MIGRRDRIVLPCELNMLAMLANIELYRDSLLLPCTIEDALELGCYSLFYPADTVQ